MYPNIFEHDFVENPQIQIIGIPYDGATSNRAGARFGPQAVFLDSQHQEWY
jgi:arginase family enzyme